MYLHRGKWIKKEDQVWVLVEGSVDKWALSYVPHASSFPPPLDSLSSELLQEGEPGQHMTPRGEDQRSLAVIYSTQRDINKCLNVTQVHLSAPPNIPSDNVWAKHRSGLANDIHVVFISHGSHLLEFD